VIDAIELEGLEAFLIHGTQSTYGRWHSWDVGNPAPKPYSHLNVGAYQVFRMSGNKTVESTFSWFSSSHIEKDIGITYGNGVFNNKNNRARAANNLVKNVMNNLTGDEDITLIGHSHGGNVAIQAVPKLREALDKAGYSHIKINLITISTPAENALDDPENPESYGSMINKHIHIYNTIDGIQTGGATIFGRSNYDRTYDYSGTENKEIDVSGKYNRWEWMDAHSWDAQNGEILEENIDNGNVPTIK
jgi:hypothetical protein